MLRYVADRHMYQRYITVSYGTLRYMRVENKHNPDTNQRNLLILMVTVSGNPTPTNTTNPATRQRFEFVNLNCIFALTFCARPVDS